MYYRVHNRKFKSLMDAMDYASQIYRRTGVIVAVEMKE